MIRIFSGPVSAYLRSFVPELAADSFSRKWIDTVFPLLRKNGAHPEPWLEDPERPVFSELVAPEYFEAFILKTASVYAGMPMLQSVPRAYRSSKHPLVKKMKEDCDIIWSKVLFSRFFMPSKDIFSFQTILPEEKTAASTAALSEALRRVNNLGWSEDAYTILSWSDSEKNEGRNILQNLDFDEYDVRGEEAAKYVYSVFFKALRFSLSGGTPMMIDLAYGEGNGVQSDRRKA